MYLDDMRTDMEIDIPEATVSKEQMIEFSKCYDPFPLHHDEDFAKGSRYGQLVAPGVMTFMMIWANFIDLHILGDQLIAGKSTRIEWFKPVFAGDTLTGKARFTKITRRNAYNGIAEIAIDVYNQHGDLVLTDVTESVVKCRP